ncbi:MAG TPA: bifunctional acetate--CoA ligase family protein/GNAT family N-acetyltransferase [Polyangiales bacterium]|nr:bifunctional acetate--CoA ligase family protein/GNAT family N-acetyltransferase [Polyangiales bacterium]
MHPLSPLFEPRSIAVIGVADRADAPGTRAFQNILAAGYRGRLFAIPAQGVHAAPLQTHASLNELPERAELVVIAEADPHVPGFLRQAAEHGAQMALVLATDDPAVRDPADSRAVDAALAQLRRSRLRVVGPHCQGVMRASLGLNASLSGGIKKPGSLALVSQSAGVCSAILDWAEARDLGFSTVASLGAASDVGVGDVLDYLTLDHETRAVVLYLEGADHPRRFISGLRALARVKPVVVVKAGRNAADGVFDAVLRRAGGVRVRTMPQLFSTAELLSRPPRIRGERLAVITNTAGLGVLAADRASDLALPLATPIDLSADATPERYADSLQQCLAEPGVDGVLLLLSPQQRTDASAIADALVEHARARTKPVLASFVGGPHVAEARDKLAAGGIPCFDAPEAAVEAFVHLASHRRNQELLLQAPDVFKIDVADIEGARLIIEAALGQKRSALTQLEAKAVLSAFGVPVTAAVRAREPDEALIAAQQMGFPVALKIDSPDIADKSEVNGVRLNLRSAAEVRSAHRELTAEVARQRPEARVLGVIVERMLQRREDRELVAGIRSDPTFGPVIALGAGHGTGAAFALPPLNTRLATDLIDQASKQLALSELPSWPAASSGALAKVLLRVSDIACELPEVRELTLDPLLADGGNVVVLDARIAVQHVPASQRKYGQLSIAPYPRELVEHVQLADGTQIVLRPIRPEDAGLEQDLVRDLSLESRRFRFMHALSRLTDDMLVRFTQLDYDRELGLIAVQRVDDAEVPLGVARYIADSDELGCEFAVVVADAWQKRGIASQLMRALIAAARARHLTHMHGDVLADNARMLRWMGRLGFEISVHPEDATVRLVTLPLK